MKQIKPSEINRTIAELLEPKPDYDLPDLYSSEWSKRDLHISLSWDGSTTASGVWVWKGLANGSWQPLDFLHDPRGTMLLLTTKTNYSYLDLADDCDAIGIYDLSAEIWIVREDLAANRSDLQEKAAIVWLRANGIEVSE